MSTLRRASARGGFTLLELVLTIAIIVLLGFLVAPKLINAYPRVAAKSEGIRLRADLAYAQQLAIAQSKNHRVSFDGGAERVSIWRAEGAGYVLASDRELEKGVNLLATTFSGGSVEFNLLGEPSEGGAVTLTGHDGTTVIVTVKPGTGLVTVQCNGQPL